MDLSRIPLGATYLGDRQTQFVVWAPFAEELAVLLVGEQDRLVPMRACDRGYFTAIADGVTPGALYYYRLNQQVNRPDPASRYQPRGVHGPSQVVSRDFTWSDDRWPGRPLAQYTIYELHIGTYTYEGTFDAAIRHLDELKRLGITAIEVMPVAQFPGTRNWGYDGVHPFAPQNSYGGPEGFKRFVDECHQRELAVILDVVYNHLGPEGNYLGEFGPYFTDRYHTPWGRALNFDGPESGEVRRFFIENALYWTTEFRVDGLRLDAVHAIYDSSARPFLVELTEAVHHRAARDGCLVHLIAESNRNDPHFVQAAENSGYGFDAQWLDDFQRSLHAVLTGERAGFYADYGSLEDLAKAHQEAFVLTGQYSQYRRRHYGASARGIAADKFVAYSQNHDQVGNRLMGERLIQLTGTDGARLAAAAVILSPYIPLLFMGEEYGETGPFHYFVSHLDAALVQAVRRGRQSDFASFQWHGEPPDPQAVETFQASKLHHELKEQPRHAALWNFYQELFRLRAALPAIRQSDRSRSIVSVDPQHHLLSCRRWDEEDGNDGDEVLVLFYFGATVLKLAALAKRIATESSWVVQLDSADECWHDASGASPRSRQFVALQSVEMRPRSCMLLSRKRPPLLDRTGQNA